jgi:hypothetical protein
VTPATGDRTSWREFDVTKSKRFRLQMRDNHVTVLQTALRSGETLAEIEAKRELLWLHLVFLER